jgi:uncharacterized membrane protein
MFEYGHLNRVLSIVFLLLHTKRRFTVFHAPASYPEGTWFEYLTLTDFLWFASVHPGVCWNSSRPPSSKSFHTPFRNG